MTLSIPIKGCNVKHNDTQHIKDVATCSIMTLSTKTSYITLSIVYAGRRIFDIVMLCHYAECHYAECRHADVLAHDKKEEGGKLR